MPTLSREKLLIDWSGETDYVQQVLLKYMDGSQINRDDLPEGIADFVASRPVYDTDARIDPEAMEVYVCGIGAMCSRVKQVVRTSMSPDAYYEEESYG